MALASGNVAGVALHGAALAHNVAEREQAEIKERDKRRSHQNVLDQIAALERQLEALRSDLVARHGEDFADKFARQYLDETTAERRAGESKEEYERRIALELYAASERGDITLADEQLRQWAYTHASLNQAELARAQDLQQQAERGEEISSDAAAADTRRAELSTQSAGVKAVLADATNSSSKSLNDRDSENSLLSLMVKQNASDTGADEQCSVVAEQQLSPKVRMGSPCN